MRRPLPATAALILLGGCAASVPIQPNQTYATIAVDKIGGEGGEVEIITLLKSNGVRVEKDPNGDRRIFDSPDCRRVLVQYRRVQRQRLNVIAQNLANINTTHGPNGANTPYRRQIVIMDPTGSVRIGDDPSPFVMCYEPASPDADSSGYVRHPNVDTAIETVNALEATRACQLAGAILRHFDRSYVEGDCSILE